MQDIGKNIAFLQDNLNRLLCRKGPGGCLHPSVYTLSIKLDKEIVKYYKQSNNQ